MQPKQESLPNFDKRGGAAAVTAEQSAAAAHLRGRLPAVRVEFDRVTGAPGFVSARDGFLTGANGAGRAVAAGHAFGRSEHAATKAFLNEHRALFGHGPEALDAARVTRDFTGAHNGLRTVVWAQDLDGVEVFGASLVSHTTKDGELVNLSSHFIPDATGAASHGGRNRAALLRNPGISAQRAAAHAARNVGEDVDETEIEAATSPAQNDPAKKQKLRARSFAGDAGAKLVWLPVKRSQLDLCWEIVSMSRSRGEMYRVLVDAQSGEVKLRQCLTEYLSDATYRIYTSDSPSPFSPGNSSSLITNQPPVLSRTLLTLPALDTNASPAGWISDGGNETWGNNVDAHTDRDANNVADLPRPQGSPSRTFDFTQNLAQDPTNYSASAVVQLFYLNNWVHDRLYALGFNEAAGNFQSNNFSRGGLGNDAVNADAQDGGGVNNANMSTPADGSPPRMQMYIFSGPTPRRDGDLDAEIVVHEYVHGLSNRRVGGGAGISALQSRGMGEGWSDFYALSLLSETNDDANAVYAMAGYATYQFLSPTYKNNYYFGIRRYPCTTDLAKNPLTFKDIDTAQAVAHAGVPLNPIFSPFNAASASEVHNQGEVWCVTLWELRANLIAAYGSATGNQLALQLVTDGMNLSPVNPNFIQARDGILQADLVNNSGANSNALWAAFAKRGLGFSAVSPDSLVTDGVGEAFDLPNDLRVLQPIGMVAKGPLGGPFTNTQTLTISNAGPAALNWSLVNTSSWLAFSPTGGTLAGGASTSIVASVTAAANVLPYGVYVGAVLFTNTTGGGGPARVFKLLAGARDYFTTGIVGAIPFEFTSFTFTPDGGDAFYYACSTPAAAFPTDPAGGTILAMGDDTVATVTLAGTNQFGIYGQRTNRLFVGSNGYLTTGSGDTEYNPTYAAHFNRRRVSGLFTDLHPGTGGTVSWRELSNRVAVTWDAVPEYGNPSITNSFQVELFFDNRIRVTYLRMSSTYGIAGLSGGAGTPQIFDPSDFTTYDNCGDVPAITAQPADLSVLAGTPADFSVTATGGARMGYQWRKNTGPIAGATNDSLHFASAQSSDIGGYSVVVTNLLGSVTSVVAALTVTNLPVVADFTGTPTDGPAPLIVTFANLSSGATNYSWNFGDGTFSTLPDPAHTFTNAGSYTVTLTAFGAGGTNALTLTDYIVVTNAASPSPVAAFSASATNGYAPLTVYFTNLTTDATAYAWNFGDGSTSALTHPANTYSNSGSYTITLVATGPGGTNTLALTNHVLVANPPLLVSPMHDGTGFSFSFGSLAGKNYSVQFKDSLDETNWQTLLPALTGDGGILTFTNMPPGAMRFYRLQTE